MYREFVGDLFNVRPEYTLCHCISKDCAMGKGIAVEFVKRNPLMKQQLLKEVQHVPDALRYQSPNNHDVINLITKELYWHKPTRESFNAALRLLRELVEKENIHYLAMPMLGSGLDKLSWKESSEYIQELFSDYDIDLVVIFQK